MLPAMPIIPKGVVGFCYLGCFVLKGCDVYG